MSKLADRTVLLVGAGSIAPGWSNGRACAVAYARAGAAVVCADFNLESAQETASLIEAEGGTALAVHADATSEADVQAAVEAAVSRFGRLDVLHNNVGVGGSSGGLEETPPEAWHRELTQNLTTAYLGMRCAVPVMREQGGGAITNTSSLLAVRFLRSPNIAYSSAKAAVEALSRASAVAYGGDNIRVNCIRIGFSETPLIAVGLERSGLSQEKQDVAMAKSRGKVPLRGEHTDPADIANVAVFLASDEARHVTGVILNVDGGLECAPV